MRYEEDFICGPDDDCDLNSIIKIIEEEIIIVKGLDETKEYEEYYSTRPQQRKKALRDLQEDLKDLKNIKQNYPDAKFYTNDYGYRGGLDYYCGDYILVDLLKEFDEYEFIKCEYNDNIANYFRITKVKKYPYINIYEKCDIIEYNVFNNCSQKQLIQLKKMLDSIQNIKDILE